MIHYYKIKCLLLLICLLFLLQGCAVRGQKRFGLNRPDPLTTKVSELEDRIDELENRVGELENK